MKAPFNMYLCFFFNVLSLIFFTFPFISGIAGINGGGGGGAPHGIATCRGFGVRMDVEATELLAVDRILLSVPLPSK